MQQKSLSWLAVHAPAAPARGKTKPKSKPASAPARGKSKLGALPEWNLADLYAGPDAPALKADLRTSDRAADTMRSELVPKPPSGMIATGPTPSSPATWFGSQSGGGLASGMLG